MFSFIIALAMLFFPASPVTGLPDTSAPQQPGAYVVEPAAAYNNHSSAVVLTIDTSDSMYGRPLEEAKRAARIFVENIDEGTPVALITFSTRVEVVLEYTTDKDELIAAIEALSLGGVTALYDGALTAAQLAADSGADKPVVILLSDGGEYGGMSQAERSDALAFAARNNVAMYTIGLGFGIDRSYLVELAEGTSGQNYEAPTADQLVGIYSELSDQFISAPATPLPVARSSNSGEVTLVSMGGGSPTLPTTPTLGSAGVSAPTFPTLMSNPVQIPTFPTLANNSAQTPTFPMLADHTASIPNINTARTLAAYNATLDITALQAAALTPAALGANTSVTALPSLANYVTGLGSPAVTFQSTTPGNLRLIGGALPAGTGISPFISQGPGSMDANPTAVVLAIDTSGSMPIMETRESARAFIESLNGSIPVAIVTFNNRVQVVQDYTTNTDDLLAAINRMTVGGVTALYDGTLTAVDLAADSGANNRVVILLSDGSEFTGLSRATREEALAAAYERNVDVYTISLGEEADREFLEGIAASSTGLSYHLTQADELSEIYLTLSSAITDSTSQAPVIVQGNNNTILSSTQLGNSTSQSLDINAPDISETLSSAPIDASLTSVDGPLLADNRAVRTIPPIRNEIASLNIDPFNTRENAVLDAIMPVIDDPLASLGLDGSSTVDVSSMLTSSIVPIVVRVPENSAFEAAELTLNGHRLATFSQPPYEFDLDTNILSAGEYNLAFTVVNSSNVVTTDNFSFDIMEISQLPRLGGTSEIEADGVGGEVDAAALGTSTTGNVTNRPGAPNAPRVLLVEGQVLQPLNLTFSTDEGLRLLVPANPAALQTTESLGDILMRPFTLLPDDVRLALTQQRPELWTAIIIIMSIILLPQGLFTMFWMLYTWNNPEIAERYSSPKEFYEPQHSFTALLPARKEQDVIADTIRSVDRIDYPDHLKEILILVRDEDDDETIARSQEVIDELGKDNIKLITFTDGPKNKPNGLNRGLKVAQNEVICIFDAEDEPHPEIYNVINTVMIRDDADVVQSGVQLINFKSTWFSALNCLEYFFWFKSGLHAFTHKFKVTPLGGNTVFFKKHWLDRIGGWDENCLTEDADVGIRLTLLGAKIQIVYDERHATQEETPDTVDSFIKQRTRWCQGFYEIFFKGDWLKLPSLTQKVTALYILLNSLLQAAIVLFLPLGIYIALTQQIAVPIALFSYIPIFLLLMQLVISLIGIREFTEAYGKKLPFMFRFKMALVYYPYQLLLAASAARAIYRFLSNKNAWEKTEHSNLHRQHNLATGGA